MTAISHELAADAVRDDAVRLGEDRRCRIEFVPDSVWENVAAGFRGICQEQLPTFSRGRWPGLDQEAILFRNGREDVVGGCLIMIQRLPVSLGAIAIVKWGPIHAEARGGVGGRSDYAGMIDALVGEYAVRRRMMLSILPRASTEPGNAEHDHLIARGFRPSSGLPFPDRYFVNLAIDAVEQRASLDQKWRYHLKRSEKAGLAFEHAGPDALPEFDRLYRAMLDRKRFADHSAYETVPALMAMRHESLRPALFFVRHDGKAVAGALIFTAGEEAVYLYGATTDAALSSRAGYFLHWHIIQWLREHTTARWYDLGGTDGFSGLHQFKKGLVGSAGVIAPIPPVANYAAFAMPRLLGEAAFGARDVVNSIQRLIEDRRPGGARRDLSSADSGSRQGGR